MHYAQLGCLGIDCSDSNDKKAANLSVSQAGSENHVHPMLRFCAYSMYFVIWVSKVLTPMQFYIVHHQDYTVLVLEGIEQLLDQYAGY